MGTNANYASSSANSFQSLPCLSKPPEPSPLIKNNTEQRPKGLFCYYVSIYSCKEYYVEHLPRTISFISCTGAWNPFEDSQSFSQMSEDAFFDAEFDRIRDSAPNAPTSAIHSLPYTGVQNVPGQQPQFASVSSVQQQLGNVNLNNRDNIQANRQAPKGPFATNRPRADPFKSAPFPLAPKNN